MPALKQQTIQMVPVVNKQGKVKAIMGVPKRTKGKGYSTKAARMAGNGMKGKGAFGLFNVSW